MDARLMLRVQRYGWDLAAPYYEQAWAEALAPVTQALLQCASLQPGEDVLDVACGSGLLTRCAQRAVQPQGRVVGTDLSQHMLDNATRHSPGCSFVRADAQALDEALPPQAFDVVLCGLGLMYVPDPAAAVAAMQRRLRRGGRLVASVWGERRECGWSAVFPIVDARVRSEVCPLFFQLGAPGALEALLGGAGLSDVASQRLALHLLFDDADAACDAALMGGPVALAYSRFDAATRAAVRAEYLRSLEPWRDGASYRVAASFVIASGRLPPLANPAP
jgi:SAM-dependent methyltransferase